MRRWVEGRSWRTLVEFVLAIRDARVCCVPLVVERVQLPVLALVYLRHGLVQEVLRPEVVLVARRPPGEASTARQRRVSAACPLRVARPSVGVGLRAALVRAGLVVEVASRLGAFLRYLMLVDHEVVVSVMGLRALLLTIVLMVKGTRMSLGRWRRGVDHSHGGRGKGLRAAVEEVVVVLLARDCLRIVQRLLAVVRIRGLSLGSLGAESLMRRLAVAGATTVEMDGRREGLHISVLDVAAMVEESTAASCLVGRASQWSWSSAGVSVHRVWLCGQSEGQVASVILRVVLWATVHKH